MYPSCFVRIFITYELSFQTFHPWVPAVRAIGAFSASAHTCVCTSTTHTHPPTSPTHTHAPPPTTHTHSTHVYAHRQHVMIMIVRILATLFKGQLRKETLRLHEEPLPAIWMRSAHLITLCALDHPPVIPVQLISWWGLKGQNTSWTVLGLHCQIGKMWFVDCSCISKYYEHLSDVYLPLQVEPLM